MSQTPGSPEPSLTDNRVIFHTIFTPFDCLFGTSEIRPVNLSIQKATSPKTPHRVKQALVTNKIADSANSIAQIVTSNLPTRKIPEGYGTIDLSEYMEPTLGTNSFWLTPLSSNASASFLVIVEGHETPNCVVSLVDETTNKPVFVVRITKEAQTNEIVYMDTVIGAIHHSKAHCSVHAGITCLSPAFEIAAALYNSLQLKTLDIAAFDFLIPALKKTQGVSRILQIELDSTSGLTQKLASRSKEAIKLRTRSPALVDNDYDTTYAGRFKEKSTSNFLLYHDSNTKRYLCTLGALDKSRYVLSVTYPLCPLQGFMAAAFSFMRP